MPKKKFKLFDAVLMSVCVILVVESAAPAAAIGPSQFFWWIALLLLFFVPYGLISAELGTTYVDEGGIYDWVKRAYGKNMGSRVAWLYWLNFPIWMASLGVLFIEVFISISKIDVPVFLQVIVELLFIWGVTVASAFKVSNSKWIMNLAAVLKVFIMLSLGILGIYFATQNGVANSYTFKNLMPDFNLTSLSFISVIIFNFMGFEVVTTLAGEMDNPKKQIPKSIIYGGALISLFYVFAAFGMGVAVPYSELSVSSGLVDSFAVLVGSINVFVVVIGAMFMFTLIANLVSWSLGVNYVAAYAAKNKDMPKIFSYESKKNGMPIAASIINALVASVLILLAQVIPNENIFWAFFALNVVALLASYIMMFPAFLKLRKIDPDVERPFKVKGGKVKLFLLTYIPVILLVLSLVFLVVPFNKGELGDKLPLLIGTIIAFALGEINILFLRKREKNENTRK